MADFRRLSVLSLRFDDLPAEPREFTVSPEVATAAVHALRRRAAAILLTGLAVLVAFFVVGNVEIAGHVEFEAVDTGPVTYALAVAFVVGTGSTAVGATALVRWGRRRAPRWRPVTITAHPDRPRVFLVEADGVSTPVRPCRSLDFAIPDEFFPGAALADERRGRWTLVLPRGPVVTAARPGGLPAA